MASHTAVEAVPQPRLWDAAVLAAQVLLALAVPVE